MREARKVEVSEPVAIEDHIDLIKHARNSAEWYCSSSMKTVEMIRTKLRDKGYPDHEVKLANGETVNYIETAVEYCQSLHLIYDDESYCEEILREALRAGTGPLQIRQKLMLKGIAPDVISDCLEDYDTHTAIENGIRKAYRSSGVRKAKTPEEERQKLIEYFVPKGFRFSHVIDTLDRLEEEEEE